MFSKKNNLFIIIVFLASVTLPLLFSDKKGGQISYLENRYLASLPELITEDWKPAPGIHNGLDNWIKDNAGGRNLALRTYYTLTYKLLHVIPEANVVGGKENWLYLIPDYDLPNYINSNIPSKDHLALLKENFTRITNSLEQKNIENVIMVWPYKYSVYPEYFPDTIKPITEQTAISVLDNELSNNPNFDFGTALEPLINGKKLHQTYFKAFDRSHWNQYGSFLAYQALMQQVQKHLPDLKILSESDFTIEPIIKETSTTWGFHTAEEDLQYSLNGGYKGVSDLTFFDTFDFTSQDPWKSFNYYKNPDSSLPKAIIIGDSFTWMFMLRNLSESFSELVFVHYSDLDSVNRIIEKIHPDILIAAGLGSGFADVFAAYQ